MSNTAEFIRLIASGAWAIFMRFKPRKTPMMTLPSGFATHFASFARLHFVTTNPLPERMFGGVGEGKLNLDGVAMADLFSLKLHFQGDPGFRCGISALRPKSLPVLRSYLKRRKTCPK